MISLFGRNKDKKETSENKPVDYKKDPKYNQWRKVFEQAGNHVAKENHPNEHEDFKAFYQQSIKKENK
jgi:hypothetical protein